MKGSHEKYSFQAKLFAKPNHLRTLKKIFQFFEKIADCIKSIEKIGQERYGDGNFSTRKALRLLLN